MADPTLLAPSGAGPAAPGLAAPGPAIPGPAIPGPAIPGPKPPDADLLFRLSAFNSAYAAAIDTGRLEAWPDFFEPDCLYKVTTAENYADGLAGGLIYADSQGMLRDRVLALRKANIYERQAYRHLVGMPMIIGRETTGIRCETPFFVARIMRDGSTSLFATGRYVDLVRETDPAGLRLMERVVVCDSSHFDTLLAIPL